MKFSNNIKDMWFGMIFKFGIFDWFYDHQLYWEHLSRRIRSKEYVYYFVLC